MSPPPPSLIPERLLAEVAWIRRLALRLATDDHQADDLVQETMTVAVTALRREATRPESIRAWLTGVLRNVFRQTVRRDRHRVEREALVSRNERMPSTADLVERASMQRSVVGVLLELEEPYRSTLLLKFFEELPHDEIARRTNVSVSTVATRVSRGLERMRERLDRRMGNTWLAALLPLREWPISSTAATLTGTKAALVMSTQIKILLSVGALTGAFFVVRSMGSRPETGSILLEERTDAVEAPELAAIVSTPDRDDGRTFVSERQAMEADALEAGAPGVDTGGMIVRGRVIDLEGSGVVGVEVHAMAPSRAARARGGFVSAFESGESMASTTTTDGGEFELEVAHGAGMVRLVSDRYTTLLAASIPWSLTDDPSVDFDTELILVVTWRVPLAGRVVDENGDPIAGAVVEVYEPEGSTKDLGIPLDRAIALPMKARSEGDGSFVVPDAADLPDAILVAFAPGYERWSTEFPAGGDEHVEIVLRAFRPDPDRLMGEVLLPNGMPAEGAFVSAGALAVSTNAAGSFALRPGRMPHGDIDTSLPLTLWAALPGYAPAQLQLPPRDEQPWPERITLELGSAADLYLKGAVVDHDGTAIEGASVHLVDQTPFGQVPADGSGSMYYSRSLEQVLSEVPYAKTDDEGRFHIEGVLDKPYLLQVLVDGTMQSVTAGPFQPGGEEARIVVDSREVGTIAGRLVDADGEAVVGVSVMVSRGVAGFGFQFGGSDITDESGAFRIDGTTTNEVTLSLSGDAIVPEIQRPLPEDADLEHLELVVGRRCHVQIGWSDLEQGVTRVRTLDEDGEPLDMINMRGNSWGPVPAAIVYGELSEVLVVSDRARWFQVLVADEEVDRIAFRPVPGEVQRVDL